MKMKSLHLRTLVLAWSMVITACLGGHTLRAQLPEMRPEFAPKYKGEILQDGQSIAMPMPEMLQRKQDSLMDLRYRERQAFYEHRNHAELDEAKVKMRRNEIMNADKEASVGDTITWTWMVEAGEEKSFSLGIRGIGNYSIDWGNGDILRDAISSGAAECVFTNTYSLAGTYTLTICSEVPITKLDCSGTWEKNGGITELDVTKNPALVELYCYHNQLTLLDVTQNPALEELH